MHLWNWSSTRPHTYLIAHLDDLCIYHWLFVSVSASFQQRDGCSNVRPHTGQGPDWLWRVWEEEREDCPSPVLHHSPPKQTSVDLGLFIEEGTNQRKQTSIPCLPSSPLLSLCGGLWTSIGGHGNQKERVRSCGWVLGPRGPLALPYLWLTHPQKYLDHLYTGIFA